MDYKVPSDEDVIQALRKLLYELGIINSQKKFKNLVDLELSKIDPAYKVSQLRLRSLALSSNSIHLEIHYRESDDKSMISKCPVCYSKLRRLKNKTIYDGTVTVGYECTSCPYSTGIKRRIPIRYIFSLR